MNLLTPSRNSFYSKMARQPEPHWMDELLKEGDLFLSPQQLKSLWKFHHYLHCQNFDRNLSTITGFEDMVVKHYIDSLLVGKLTSLPSPLLDIGTGAGFPGIPLKIVDPDLHLILAEQQPRKVQFLKGACKELGLQKIGIFSHKVTPNSFQTPMEGVITRAETLSKTLLRALPFLQPKGKVILMKGPAVDQEIREVQNNSNLNEVYHLIENHSYALPRIGHKRRLLVFEKKS